MDQKFKHSQSSWLHNFLGWLRHVWDIEWGERQAKSSVLSVIAASLGTFIVLVILVIRGLISENFVKLAIDYLAATEDVLFLFIVIIILISIVAFISLIVGLGVYASSSNRSYLSYAWRGALVIPIMILVAEAIVLLSSVV